MEYELRLNNIGTDYSGVRKDYGFNGSDSYVSSGVERSVGGWDSNPFDIFGKKKTAKGGDEIRKEKKYRGSRQVPMRAPPSEGGKGNGSGKDFPMRKH